MTPPVRFRVQGNDFTTEARRALRACTEDAEALSIRLALTGARGRRALLGAAVPLAPVTRRFPRRGGATRRGPCRFIPLCSPFLLCVSVVRFYLFERDGVSVRPQNPRCSSAISSSTAGTGPITWMAFCPCA